MESVLVIKVKYGENLRRFSAHVVDEKLDLDIDGLRKKIFGLFNFTPDTELLLTYIDEDGDVVTLVDDEDLHDAIKQSLDPLRITVKLNSEQSRFYARSSGSSNPRRSTQVQHEPLNLNTSSSEMLKSVPEPFREAISKLAIDLAVKTSSSAPVITELVDFISKMGPSYMGPGSKLHSSVESSQHGGASGTLGLSVTEDLGVSKINVATSEVQQSAAREPPTSLGNQVLPDAKSEGITLKTMKVHLNNIKKCKKESLMPHVAADSMVISSPISVNANSGHNGGNHFFECAPANPASGTIHDADVKKEEAHVSADNDNVDMKLDEYPSTAKCKGFKHLNITSGTASASAGVIKKTKNPSDCHRQARSVGGGASASSFDYLKPFTPASQNMEMGGGVGMKPSGDFRNLPGSQFDINLLNERTIIGTPVANDPAVRLPYGPCSVPFKRSYNHSGGREAIFHRGVRCDGCGVRPITGPRFKSKIKEDYDLCHICVRQMGNEADYIRIDRPITYRHPFAFKGMYDPVSKSCVRPPTLSPVLEVMNQRQAKLDSCFILDVNVLDGTIMAPSTPFTMIWRMRNNGTILWPQGTQLVWIGGDKLSNAPSVELEIPADGLPADGELDIAVDFTAPELPGQYSSYWRMALPSGQKFGQRVWVIIQVNSSTKDTVCESLKGLNLNLPPPSNVIPGPEIINVNVEPVVEDRFPNTDNSKRETTLFEPVVDNHPSMEQNLKFPINGSFPDADVSKPSPGDIAVSDSYPIVDLSEISTTVRSLPPPPTRKFQTTTQMFNGNNNVEKNLLKELEVMGFKQVDLNREILRMNDYNLEQSVNHLCGVAESEWDLLLNRAAGDGFL